MSASKESDQTVESTPKRQRSGIVRPLNPEALAHEPKNVVAKAELPAPAAAVAATPPKGGPTPTPPKSPAMLAIPMRGIPPWGGATAMTEAEFLLTRNIIAHMQPTALISVLQSLIDDFPQLAPTIRVRCETAMSILMGQAVPTPFGGHLPHPYAQGSAPVANSPAAQWNEPTPPGAQHRRSLGHRRSTKDEETEMCAVHGTMRTMKHLHYVATANHYECIPGFHCLEGNGITPTSSPQAGSVPPGSAASNAVLSKSKPKPQENEDFTVKHVEDILSALRQQQQPDPSDCGAMAHAS